MRIVITVTALPAVLQCLYISMHHCRDPADQVSHRMHRRGHVGCTMSLRSEVMEHGYQSSYQSVSGRSLGRMVLVVDERPTGMTAGRSACRSRRVMACMACMAWRMPCAQQRGRWLRPMCRARARHSADPKRIQRQGLTPKGARTAPSTAFKLRRDGCMQCMICVPVYSVPARACKQVSQP